MATLPEWMVKTPVTDRTGAVRWLMGLVAHDAAFHLDDAAGSIVDMRSGRATFPPESCPGIDARVDEVRRWLPRDGEDDEAFAVLMHLEELANPGSFPDYRTI